MTTIWRRLTVAVLLLTVAIGSLLGLPQPVNAGPVNWVEVAATDAGQQWWDSGSLRVSKNGTLSVLSRFQAAPAPAAAEAADAKPRILGDLYVMEIDCGQTLYRDTSVNGLPRWGAEWQPADGDGLITAVIAASCSAAGLLPS